MSRRKKIISIVGARPQFIKHAPIQIELEKVFDAVTVHTGQHYDAAMSEVFFKELNISRPDYLLNGGGGSHGAQTGAMMTEIESICFTEKPDAVLVYGDTNSTLAGALVAAKLNLPQIHIEAGLRSFNRSMPEEVNRIVADVFAHILFIPAEYCRQNLANEGISHNKIFTVGDVMCDTLKMVLPLIKTNHLSNYYLATIHRPYNTDNIIRLKEVLESLNSLDKEVVMPLHPRTLSKMTAGGVEKADFPNIRFIDPVGYIDNISYQMQADAVITDSGGMQKEAYMLKKKCVTIRTETEWLETLENDWNELVFADLRQNLVKKLQNKPGNHNPQLFGDGQSAKRIVEIIRQHLI